jgi:hypothetical protein
MGMSKMIIGAMLCLFVIVPSAGSDGDRNKAGWSKKRLQQLYMTYLKKQGYGPEVDGDGDIRFKWEGRTLFISLSEDDPLFFHLVLPNIWEVESEAERADVLAAADTSNALCKASKIFIVDDRVWVSIELFLKSPEDFKGFFKRSIGALGAGVSVFVLKMAERIASRTQGKGGTKKPASDVTPKSAQEL